MDSEELVLRFAAVDGISNVIEGIGRKIEQFGATLSQMGGNAGAAMGQTAEGIGVAVAGIGGLAAAGAGVFAMLDHLATQTATYALTVDRWSSTLKVGTDWLQTMYQAGKLTGIGMDQLNLAFGRFAKNLEDGGIQLKAMHMTLADVGITSTNVQVAFTQLADKFHTLDDASQKLAISTLFGRNAMATLIPILNLGGEGVSKLTEEFRSFGLILDSGSLAVDGAAKVMQDKLHLVLQGLEMTIGNALIPAFMTLWTLLGKILDPLNKAGGAANALGKAFAQAVVWIAAFISALTGTSVSLDDISRSLQDNSAIMALVGGTAQDTGNSIDALANSTQALQDKASAFDDSIQGQTDSLHAQQNAVDELAASQQAQLDVQKQSIDLAFQQWNQQNSLSDANSKLASDQALLSKESQKAGFDPTSLKQTIIADQNAILRQKATMQVDAAKHEIDLQKQVIDQTRKLKDDAFKDELTRLSLTKKASDDYYKDLIKADKAKQASGLSTNAALGQSGRDLANSTIGDMGLTKAAISDMAGAGVGAAGSVQGAWARVADTMYNVQRAIINTGNFLRAVGDEIGFVVSQIGAAAFMLKLFSDLQTGNLGALGGDFKTAKDLQSSANQSLSDALKLGDANNAALAQQHAPTQYGSATVGATVPAYADGGIVSGPIGAPQLAVVHGGETVTPAGNDGSSETNALLRQLVAQFSATGSNGQFMTVMRALMQQMNSQSSRGVRGGGLFPA